MKHALILEGGGMRGIFTTGVIDQFLKIPTFFDMVYAVSAGADHACSYLGRQPGRAYAVSTDYAGDPRFAGMESLRKTGDLFNVDFIYHQIPEKLYPMDNDAFLRSGERFTVVMTNCVTGRAEYHEVKDLFRDMKLVRASASMPFAARMVPYEGGVYLDGGISDPVPVRRAAEDGYRKNVVVLTQPKGYRKRRDILVPAAMRFKYRKYPKLIRAMEHRAELYNAEMDDIDRRENNGEIFVIRPMGPLDIGRAEMDRDKLRKGYEEGYYVAEGLRERMLAFLGEDQAEG